jgi:phosphatidylserine/phosphatidylglycerophosphate/cardiolipin synthase-like enzyme
MITTTDARDFVRAVASAHRIAFSAYHLAPGGPVRAALIDAAKRGADVGIRLEANPYGGQGAEQGRENGETVAAVNAAGGHAVLVGAAGEPPWHMKAAVVDGVAFLDDRNWAADGKETILRDTDTDDVAVVERTLAGTPARDGHLRTTKHDAVALESEVIRSAGDRPVSVETESFGLGAIYADLLHRAQAGQPTRLLVSSLELAEPGDGREQRALARLAAAGIEVRQVENDEKITLAGAEAWVGSANATYANGPAGEQVDWGLATRVPSLVEALRAAFERNWAAGRRVV